MAKDPFNPTVMDDLKAGLMWMLFFYGLWLIFRGIRWVIKTIATELWGLLKSLTSGNVEDGTLSALPEITSGKRPAQREIFIPPGHIVDQWGNIRRQLPSYYRDGILHIEYDPPGPIGRTHPDGTPGPNPIKGCPNIHDF